ncbi:hypothetical protein N431DRAFT_434036 [Stipitochalara longipes BDJ]|nr:hypothetical protein N431DRAFT_434036 [Stipitochalara longipes BDJ]
MISGPKVDVYVGPTEKYYNLPKLLLCHYSDFFDTCFNGGFMETLSQKLYLPDDKIEDFEILLEFMLRGTSPGSIKLTEVSTGAFQFPTIPFSLSSC